MAKKRTKKKKKGHARKDGALGSGLILTSYDIVYEPVDVAYEVSKLNPEEAREKEELYYLARENPKEAIPRLKDFIARHPDIPSLYNHLTAAYHVLGDRERQRELILETYRIFPDYLFGKLSYVELCLAEDKLEEIPRILDGKYDLKFHYPERTKFHVTEFTAFEGTVGYYFCRIGDLDTAEKYYEILRGIEPEDPQTKRLEKALRGCRQVEKLRRFLFSRLGK